MMSKISELIEYREALYTSGLNEIILLTSTTKDRLKEIESLYPIPDKNLTKLIASLTMEELILNKNLKEEIDAINSIISSLESKYILISNTMYDSFKTENYEARKNVRIINDDFRDFVKTLVEKYSDYRYPGLELSPMHYDLTNSMISFDPIYLVDQDPTMLSNMVEMFDSKFSHKLRTYTMNLRGDVGKLPLKSIGFVSAVNAFEQYNNEALESVLKNIYSLLLPGASILFTFNNCDFASGAKQVEKGRACYHTTKSVDMLMERLGYICIKFIVFNGHETVVEAKIPGILESKKISPAIGQIIDVERLAIDEKEMYYKLLKENKLK